jgi:Putative peptidoglycan binding domain/Resolvase, N terminal domain
MDRRWPLAALATALAWMTAPAALAAGSDPPAAAGWHGRTIRDPLPRVPGDTVARFPRGWSAGGVGRGSGYGSTNGSRRVREVQQRLVRRGYRPGPVDGRYGPRTRAAVIWFQIKHGLARTGRVDARSLAALRRPPHAPRAAATDEAPSSPRRARAGALAGPSPPERATPSWPWLLGAVIMVGLAALVWARRRGPARPAQVCGHDPHARPTAIAPPARHAPVDVVGYVALERGERPGRDLESAARVIGSWCEDRGWRLLRVVHDVAPTSARISDRPGLAYVLDQIAAGRVAGLVLARQNDLTHSVTELAKVLQWLDKAQAFMITLDAEPDASSTGERAPRAPTAMPADGPSRPAISDALNPEAGPPLRADTRTRRSSVAAATGAKRPHATLTGTLERSPLEHANAHHTRGRWDDDPN